MKKFLTGLALVAALTLSVYPVVPSLMAHETSSLVQQADYQEISDSSPAILAALLSIIPGLGQVYLGYVSRGIMIFVADIFLFAAGILLNLILYPYLIGIIPTCIGEGVYIVSIVDAYFLATKKSSGGGKDEEDEDYDKESMLHPDFTPVYQIR